MEYQDFNEWLDEHDDEIAEEIANQTFAEWFASEYDRMIRTLNDDDYLVDEDQQGKLFAIVGQFIKLQKEIGGHIDDIDIVPRMETGGVTATFPIVDLSGKSVRDFCLALAEASAISMDAAEDGVCISVTVPHVFRKKP